MKYEDITAKIISAAFEIINELGSGFLESVYEKAMINALKQKLLANKNPVMTVSSWQVATSPLQAQKTAVASLRAIFGVNVIPCKN